MKCKKCLYQNEPGTVYCAYCGEPLSSQTVCSRCSYSNGPGAKYCKHCGAQLSLQQSEARTSGVPRAPKRKRVPKWAIALIVIGICNLVLPLSIAAVILIPTFADVTEKANAKSALSDARNALSTYIANRSDSNSYFSIDEDTLFVVEKSNKYYVFVYTSGRLETIANGVSERKCFDTINEYGYYSQDLNDDNIANMPSHIMIFCPLYD